MPHRQAGILLVICPAAGRWRIFFGQSLLRMRANFSHVRPSVDIHETEKLSSVPGIPGVDPRLDVTVDETQITLAVKLNAVRTRTNKATA